MTGAAFPWRDPAFLRRSVHLWTSEPWETTQHRLHFLLIGMWLFPVPGEFPDFREIVAVFLGAEGVAYIEGIWKELQARPAVTPAQRRETMRRIDELAALHGLDDEDELEDLGEPEA